MNQELIVVRQLPIIEEQLKVVQQNIEARVQEALSMVCTEETYKEVKKLRSALNKEYGELEAKRKEVKAAILAPYEQFEGIYKKYAGDLYADADAKLKARITEVEDGLKRQKEDDLRSYFDEYRESRSIPSDLVALENARIRIGLADSKKALHAKAKEYLDRIAGDLALIDTQPRKDEILVEYRKCLDISRAVTTVDERHKAMESERQRREADEAARAEKEKAAAAVEEIAQEDTALTSAPLMMADPEAEQEIVEETEKVYATTFRVTEKGAAGLEKLRALKKFLIDGGYTYEQL